MIRAEQRAATDGSAVRLLVMEHGKVNAVDTELFEDLIEALDPRDPTPVVLTGSGRAFSAGVDLFRILNEGRSYLEEFLPALTRGLHALFTHPRPVVAAINGHAIAGGAILACAADRRLLVEEGALMGVPEVLVGVPYPTLALEVLRFAAAPRYLQELVWGGATYPPPQALERGLADELVATDDLLDRAVETAGRLAAVPLDTFSLTKRALRRSTLERWEDRAPTDDPQVLEVWADEEVQRGIRQYLERTLSRS